MPKVAESEGMEGRATGLDLDSLLSVHRRWTLFAHAYLLYARTVERALRPWDLSLPQFLTLFLLKNSTRPVTPTLLATYLAQMAQSVTSLVQRMEKRGLIRRVRNQGDGRSVLLELRTEGEQMLDESFGTVLETVRHFFSPLSEERQLELEEMLEDLRDQAAMELGIDPKRLEVATRGFERDPDMWTQAQVIRDSFAPHPWR